MGGKLLKVVKSSIKGRLVGVEVRELFPGLEGRVSGSEWR